MDTVLRREDDPKRNLDSVGRVIPGSDDGRGNFPCPMPEISYIWPEILGLQHIFLPVLNV